MNEFEILIVQLAEEATEVAQRCCKVIRFGRDDIYEGKPNLMYLMDELADFEGVLTKLQQMDHGLPHTSVEKVLDKMVKIQKYLDYSREQGRLD